MKCEMLLILEAAMILLVADKVRSQCSKQDYNNCVKLADPLLKDPHLIYPDNPRDIEHVCRTWTFFVDCVKQYTERCFTEARRQEFNKAVETPVSSVHKLCSMPDYREDYLKHAGCMKMTLTQDSLCGRHYRLLVSQVSGEAPTASVCCSHHLFRECVLDQTKNSCEPDSAPFSSTMLDKALSFLRDQCVNFKPNQLDCPGTDFYKSTARSETKLEHEIPATRPVENTRTSQQPWTPSIPSIDSRSTPTTRGETKETWTPTITKTSPTTTTQDSSNTIDAETSRSSSYGRGMTWSTTGQSWRVSSDIWLPSSKPPSMIDNAIDEPNQQGLGADSSASGFSINFELLTGVVLWMVKKVVVDMTYENNYH